MLNTRKYAIQQLFDAYDTDDCAMCLQLGLMGMTILYSSGDDGVAGSDDYCLEPNGTQAIGAPRFNPSFPGTCPYITSVGATQVSPNHTVRSTQRGCTR